MTTLFVLSERDPVAHGVGERWGTPPAAGIHIGGALVRLLGPDKLLLRRAELHIEDEALDPQLLEAFGPREITVVFPSIHRSRSGPHCFTVHPLGNPRPDAPVGGTPGFLVPTDPRLMAAALRAADAAAGRFGVKATFESTHHGPTLHRPAFFAEIGGGPNPERPPAEEVNSLAELLLTLEPSPTDRIAVGIGGGHYVPHFTDLALERRWAFGHLLSDHVLPNATSETFRRAIEATSGCEGLLFARSRDVSVAPGVGPRLRDSDAPTRVPSRNAGT
ncbi:MAG: D-aminoacyl-tRNA deacylase [Thermoplasmata archaeon]|nr:D-aminoacyl-tRNA deacylase [Thermoplasmata archaeon]